MPIKLISAGGGSVSLNPDTTTSALNLTVPAENGTVITSGATSRIIPKAAMPSGSIIQVQQAYITSVFSTTSTSYVDITGLGISITPTLSTSKILVMASLYRGCSSAVITNFRLTRAGTPIYVGDAAGTKVQSSGGIYVGTADNQAHIGVVEIKYLDSPSTASATTYQVQMRTQSGETVYVGRTGGDSDGGAYSRTPASIIVMEVAQ